MGGPHMCTYAGQSGAVVEENSEDETVRVMFSDQRFAWFPVSALKTESTERRVRIAALDKLMKDVRAHSELEWDPQMRGFAGAFGTVEEEDASDGTACVKVNRAKV